MEEKYEGREIQVQSKFLKWWDNYWYHYKWHTILIGFFALVLIVCLVQCSSAEDPDITVCFAGNQVFSEAEYTGLKTVFEDVCPRDIGNGAPLAAFKTLSIFSEEQLISHFTFYYEEEDKWELDRDGMALYKATNLENYKNMQTYVMTGDCAVFFVSSYVYSEMFHDLRIEGATKLSDTHFYKTFDAAKAMPEDTMVVLMRPMMGKYANDKQFAQAKAYYQSVVEGTK